MKDETSLGTALAAAFGIIIGAIAIMVYAIMAYAFVGMTLWNWFMVPLFGIPALSMANAWGISMLVHMWTYNHNPWKGEDERDTKTKVIEFLSLLLRPWFVLAFGWIALKFV